MLNSLKIPDSGQDSSSTKGQVHKGIKEIHSHISGMKIIVKKESINGLKRQIKQFDSTLDKLVDSAKKATESQKNAKRRTKKLLKELRELKIEI